MTSVAEKLQSKAPKKAVSKQVRLRLVYIDFWSVVKLGFLTGICVGIIQVVVVVMIWVLLNTFGVFDTVSGVLGPIINNDAFNITTLLPLNQLTLFAVVVAVLNIVLGTALGAIAAVLYNFAAKITGGLLVGFQNA
jgi:hypothetical protein